MQARYSAALDLDDLHARLRSGPLSPWVFVLYSKLVMDLTRDAQEQVAVTFEDIVQAASLAAEPGVVAFNEAVIPDRWWDHLTALF